MKSVSKSILIVSVLCFQFVSSFSKAQVQNEIPLKLIAEQYLSEIANIANQVQLGADVAYSIGNVAVSDKCVAFMTKEMFLGPNGKNIFSSFVRNKDILPNLVDGGSIAKYCPKYPAMNLEKKGLVWVVILTMMAHFESSCSAVAKAKGPNGTAYGYYQLHLGKESSYDGKLNLCIKNASKSAKLSNECTLGILERQLLKQNMEVFSKTSYWDVLRPNGEAQKADDIQRALMNSSLCSPKTM